MNTKPLFSGQNKHPGNQQWLEEIEETNKVENWKDVLLSRIKATLGNFGDEVKRIGYKINEAQIQYRFPINAMFSFKPLQVMWVQFNTWDPFTKKPGTRTVRFGPDTASLMVLVKVPNSEGSFDWYMLTRKKYQFAAQEHFVEFSRGWVPGVMESNMGWALFDRDYPGFRVNGKGANFVKSIYCTQLSHKVWENTAEFSNHICKHLAVVTLNQHLEKEELKKILTVECLKKEYRDKPEYSNLDKLDQSDLVSEPIIFDLAEAAEYLNAHLTEKEADKYSPIFGEEYSDSCWTAFLATYGWQFPEIMPEKRVLPA